MGMLSLADNELTTLDLSKTPAIESLNLQNNHLTSLNVHGLTSISTLNVKLNQLATLDLSGLNTLRTLIVSDNPALTSLEVSTLTSLSSIRADNCALEQIALPASITEFYAKGNKLTTLGEETLSLAKLKRLRVPNNQIAQVTLGECPLLNDLELDGNQLTSLTLGSLPALRTFTYRAISSMPRRSIRSIQPSRHPKVLSKSLAMLVLRQLLATSLSIKAGR